MTKSRGPVVDGSRNQAVAPGSSVRRLCNVDVELAAGWNASRVVEEDFSSFCEHHYGRVASAVLLYCADQDLADECAQEAFARAYRDWRKVRKMRAPAAWVYRVAINVANSSFRRRAVERRQLSPGFASAEAADEAVVTADTIQRALSGIPRRRRAALIMRHYSDMSIPEIADALGCSEDGAKKLIHRAKTALRAELARSGWEVR